MRAIDDFVLILLLAVDFFLVLLLAVDFFWYFALLLRVCTLSYTTRREQGTF
jgi:hypothetical protein